MKVIFRFWLCLIVVGLLQADSLDSLAEGLRQIAYDTAIDSFIILPYDALRDKLALLQIFEDNFYLLTTTQDKDQALKEFSSELDRVALGQEKYLKLVVLYKDGKTKGFVSYKPQLRGEGKIDLIAVGKEYRGKGYGKLLLEYAFEQLKQKGTKTVSLVTRTGNAGALKLYKKLGFVVSSKTNGLVFLKKTFA